MDLNSVIIEVKPPINKIVIDEEFEKNAIKIAKAFGNKDIESLQTDLQNFKQDIEKMNNGQMDYSTMRSLYG
jgi:hypothetical protein